jgi:hypothetical protein
VPARGGRSRPDRRALGRRCVTVKEGLVMDPKLLWVAAVVDLPQFVENG